jgi:hypothetical protein
MRVLDLSGAKHGAQSADNFIECYRLGFQFLARSRGFFGGSGGGMDHLLNLLE